MKALIRWTLALVKSRYLIAALAVAVVTALRFLMHPLVSDIAPMLLFLAAVAFSAWQGFGPGLLATIGGSLVGAIGFTEPRFVLQLDDWHDELRLLLFVAEGVVISALGGLSRRRKIALERSIAEAKRTNRQLDLAEKEASESELRLRNLTEAVPHIVWTADANGAIDFFNQRWNQITGLEPAASSGRSWHAAVHPDDLAGVVHALTEAGPSSGINQFEFRLRTRDGGYRWMLSRAVPQLNQVGKLEKWVGTFSDITESKAAAKDLLLAKQSADQANAAKSRFVANMSHEIRTPLGAIVGFAELLKGSDATPSERELYLATIIRNGQHLAHLIDDILDLSKVEADRLEIDPVATSLPNLIDEVRALLEPQATAKGISLAIHTAKTAPSLCSTDPSRLRQILINVVGNALKFTDQGSVSVAIDAGPKDAEGRCLLSFTVKDSGAGIDPAQQSRLFQPFTQADVSTTRRYGGTGLGLVLSRRLARLLGGDLVLAASTPGVGSTFIATVQVGAIDKPQEWSSPYLNKDALAKAKVSLDGIRVLLAEDSKDVQLLIKTILGARGAKTEIAADGDEAVRKAMSGDHDIVLMDMQMPVKDGLDATKELRQLGWRKPIIALTAHAMKEERESCLAAGCNRHLIKPVDHGELVATIRQLLDRGDVAGPLH